MSQNTVAVRVALPTPISTAETYKSGDFVRLVSWGGSHKSYIKPGTIGKVTHAPDERGIMVVDWCEYGDCSVILGFDSVAPVAETELYPIAPPMSPAERYKENALCFANLKVVFHPDRTFSLQRRNWWNEEVFEVIKTWNEMGEPHDFFRSVADALETIGN